jgi:hypothetical protein
MSSTIQRTILNAMPRKLLRAAGAATLVAMGQDFTRMVPPAAIWDQQLAWHSFPRIAKIAENCQK